MKIALTARNTISMFCPPSSSKPTAIRGIRTTPHTHATAVQTVSGFAYGPRRALNRQTSLTTKATVAHWTTYNTRGTFRRVLSARCPTERRAPAEAHTWRTHTAMQARLMIRSMACGVRTALHITAATRMTTM